MLYWFFLFVFGESSIQSSKGTRSIRCELHCRRWYPFSSQICSSSFLRRKAFFFFHFSFVLLTVMRAVSVHRLSLFKSLKWELIVYKANINRNFAIVQHSSVYSSNAKIKLTIFDFAGISSRRNAVADDAPKWNWKMPLFLIEWYFLQSEIHSGWVIRISHQARWIQHNLHHIIHTGLVSHRRTEHASPPDVPKKFLFTKPNHHHFTSIPR